MIGRPRLGRKEHVLVSHRSVLLVGLLVLGLCDGLAVFTSILLHEWLTVAMLVSTLAVIVWLFREIRDFRP